MDVIRLELTQHHDPWKKASVDMIDIWVNDLRLQTIVAEVERPFAEGEGNPSLAGEYLPLEPSDVGSASQHFLGGKDSNLLCEPEDHTVLLRCAGCSGVWCWPLLTRVSVLEQFVIWSDFVQPHRMGKWNYEGMKFTFSRHQYEDALRE